MNAVIGKKSKSIISLKQSTAWGENSIISYLSKQKAIGIGINIDIEIDKNQTCPKQSKMIQHLNKTSIKIRGKLSE